MFCGNCGQELKDNAKFCHGCGCAVGAVDTPAQWNNRGGTPRPGRGKKKKKSVIWIPIVAAVVVLAVLVVALAGGLGGDSANLVKALAKSGKAYTTAAENMNMPDLSFIAEKKAYSSTVSVWIEEMEGSSEMGGMGVQVAMDASMSEREIGMSITPYFGAVNLITAQMKIDDEKVYIGAKELTGDTFYMINTETLGQDLNNLGADMGELAGLSLNLFDVAEKMERINAQNEQVSKDMQKAFLAFAETIEVEKTGTETIEVNGNDLKSTAYHVVIAEDAMNDLLDAIEESYNSIDNTAAYLEIYESMGLPDEVMAELMYSLKSTGAESAYMFDDVRNVLDVLEVMELDVYVNGGYVVAAVYEGSLQGSDVEIILNLGGGENYVDDICLRMIVDGSEVRVTSSGNHSGAGGKFTDETTVEVIEGTYEYTALEMEMSYEPKASADNFKWKMESDSIGLDVQGQVTAGNDSISMRLDEISIAEYGYDLMTIGVEYQIGKYEGSSINTRNSVALGQMTQDELMNELMVIQENAAGWLQELMNQFPDLMYYLY